MEQQQSTGWQLEGDSAASYERYLVPAIMGRWARVLVEATGVGRGDRVLDLACGTGIVARVAAQRTGRAGEVVGVDVNSDMLAVARRTAAAEGHEVTWREGDASKLPAEDGSFDVVLCQQGLQFFPEPLAALAEGHRVLRTGGRLGLSVLRSLEHNRAYRVLAEVLERHVGPEAAAMMRSPFEGPPAERLRTLAHEADLRGVHITIHRVTARYPSPAEFLRREAASSPLAGPVGAIDQDQRARLIEALEKELSWCMDDEGLAVPLETNLVTARR